VKQPPHSEQNELQFHLPKKQRAIKKKKTTPTVREKTQKEVEAKDS